MRARLARPILFAVAGAVVGLVLLAVGSLPDQSPASRHIQYSGIGPLHTLDELRATAELVLVVSPSGIVDMHWNSSDNREWAPRNAEERALIYRDERFRVVRVVSGAYEGASVVIRNLGGTVGDVSMSFEDAPEFEISQEYLVFLRQAMTPTREGPELMWTVVWQNQGVFEPVANGLWENPWTEVRVSEDAL